MKKMIYHIVFCRTTYTVSADAAATMSLYETVVVFVVGGKYMIELPDSATILYIVCMSKALHACDLKIMGMEQRGMEQTGDGGKRKKGDSI